MKSISSLPNLQCFHFCHLVLVHLEQCPHHVSLFFRNAVDRRSLCHLRSSVIFTDWVCLETRVDRQGGCRMRFPHVGPKFTADQNINA